jgi:hypothetical protein
VPLKAPLLELGLAFFSTVKPNSRRDTDDRAPLRLSPTQHRDTRYCGLASIFALSKSAANGNNVFSQHKVGEEG